MIKISTEEKQFIDKISALSRKDKTTVKEILLALLTMSSIEIYKDNYEIYIPYICKLKISYNDKCTPEGVTTIVNLEAIPSEALINEISAISEGESSPSEKYIKKLIFQRFQTILDLEDVEIED